MYAKELVDVLLRGVQNRQDAVLLLLGLQNRQDLDVGQPHINSKCLLDLASAASQLDVDFLIGRHQSSVKFCHCPVLLLRHVDRIITPSLGRVSGYNSGGACGLAYTLNLGTRRLQRASPCLVSCRRGENLGALARGNHVIGFHI